MITCARELLQRLEKCCGAAPVMVSASSTMKTLHGASAGRVRPSFQLADIVPRESPVSPWDAGGGVGRRGAHPGEGHVGPSRGGRRPRPTSALAKARRWSAADAVGADECPRVGDAITFQARRSMSDASSCSRIAQTPEAPRAARDARARAHDGGMQRVLGLRASSTTKRSSARADLE